MWKKVLALAVLLSAFGLGGCFWVSSVPDLNPVGRKILLPLYIYPSWWDSAAYLWDDVAAAAAKAEIWAIVNQASGPGGPPNSDYVRGMNDLRAAGITMLGYVWTNYGGKSIADVKAEVDTYAEYWKDWVSGIFFDGVNSSASWLPYYRELDAYAREKGFQWVVLNPGTTIAEEYLEEGVGDVIVIYEDNYMNFLAHTFPDYVGRYPKERFAILIWGVPTLEEAKEVLRRATGIAFVQCTDDVPPNEWDTLPSYWADWIELLRQPLYYVP
ncbi:MAG: spherulation-specific family 4 protein [Candidatus Bipolaricaulaceae bacterium]